MREFLVLVAFAILLSFGSIAYATGGQEEGLAVKNWKGEYIGSFIHVLTDSSSGNIVLAIRVSTETGQPLKQKIQKILDSILPNRVSYVAVVSQ